MRGGGGRVGEGRGDGGDGGDGGSFLLSCIPLNWPSLVAFEGMVCGKWYRS